MRGSSAYVLVQTETGATHIARRLQAVPGVVFAEDVRGPYDALALARSDGAAETLQTILDEIRSLPGVLRALAAPLVPAPVGVPSSDAA